MSQIVRKHKLQLIKSNETNWDHTQTMTVTTCYKTQVVTKHQLCWNTNCDKTQIVTKYKLWRNTIFDKKNYLERKKHKLQQSTYCLKYFSKTTWQYDGAALCNIAMFLFHWITLEIHETSHHILFSYLTLSSLNNIFFDIFCEYVYLGKL